MEIALTPKLEKRIAAKVAGGEFPSAEEVVREGLRRLFAEEEEYLAEMRARIQEGIDSANRGELISSDELFAELDEYIHELTGLRP